LEDAVIFADLFFQSGPIILSLLALDPVIGQFLSQLHASQFLARGTPALISRRLLIAGLRVSLLVTRWRRPGARRGIRRRIRRRVWLLRERQRPNADQAEYGKAAARGGNAALAMAGKCLLQAQFYIFYIQDSLTTRNDS
jgi:hypothetical protein